MSSMFMEELSSFYRVPNSISLEFSDGQARSTVRQENNAVFFTRE